MDGFKDSVITSICRFIQNYNIDFEINYNQTPEGMLNSLLTSFKYQKQNEKIYVGIDEYDYF